MEIAKQKVWLKHKDGTYSIIGNNKTIITKDGKKGVIKNDGRDVMLVNMNRSDIWVAEAK